jgi:hypothetical protein
MSFTESSLQRDRRLWDLLGERGGDETMGFAEAESFHEPWIASGSDEIGPGALATYSLAQSQFCTTGPTAAVSEHLHNTSAIPPQPGTRRVCIMYECTLAATIRCSADTRLVPPWYLPAAANDSRKAARVTSYCIELPVTTSKFCSGPVSGHMLIRPSDDAYLWSLYPVRQLVLFG